ncbi:MAG: tetratricopeptide repeat protein [Planctomycetota bacterium]|jgi:tetratricopeptide (TPR) repeat protein
MADEQDNMPQPRDPLDDFEISDEEMAGLSAEEQEIIRQQEAIMRGEAEKKAQAEAAEEGSEEGGSAAAEGPDDGLDFREEELEGLSPEEREIIHQQQAIMRAEAAAKAEIESGPPLSGDGMSLQAIIAKQKVELGGEDEDNDPPEAEAKAETDGEPSLADIIAQQKSQVKGEQEADSEAEGEEESAEAEPEPAATASSGQSALQDVIAQQKAQLQDDAEGAETEQSDSASGGGLQDIIAQQKAQLNGEADDEGEHTEDEAGDNPLAAAIAQQKVSLKGDPAPEAAPEGVVEAPEISLTASDAADEGDADAPDADEADAAPAVAATAGATTGLLSRLSLDRLSMIHLLLGMNVLIVLLVVGMMLTVGGRPKTVSVAAPRGPVATPEAIEERVVAPDEEFQPGVSWEPAEAAYREGDYELAESRFARLLQLVEHDDTWAFYRDFFRLRQGMCQAKLGRRKEAQDAMSDVLATDSPVLRAMAHYRTALTDLEEGRALQARTRAYLALGTLGALGRQIDLERDCDFLIAWSMSHKAMSFSASAPPMHPAVADHSDPFASLDAEQLKRLLKDGMGRTAQAGLGPDLQRVASRAASPRWSALCAGSEVEVMLQRIASAADCEIRWVSVSPRVRMRSLTMAAWAQPAQRLAEVACGATGLIARFTGEEILVHNPLEGDSLSAQRDLLFREAISAWRRFSLRWPDDGRNAAGSYALASVYESSGDSSSALEQYQVTSRRFSKSPAAPLALLQSAKIRLALHDHAGARDDLLELLNAYPDNQSIEDIYLALGEATAKAGLREQALRVYAKLFFLDLSLQSSLAASFGAGDCCYQRGDYEQAATWFQRYLTICQQSEGDGPARTYYMLGRSYHALGQADEGVAALYCALAAKPAEQLTVDILLTLVSQEADRENWIRAAGALARMNVRKLTGDRPYRYLLNYGRVYRAMGLPEKAVTMINGYLTTVPDAQHRARLVVEVARCHTDQGDLDTARQILSDALPAMQAGPAAMLASCELAESCLEAGQVGQAIVICEYLIHLELPADIGRRVSSALGAARLMEGDYARAAKAFAGLGLAAVEETTP